MSRATRTNQHDIQNQLKWKSTKNLPTRGLSKNTTPISVQHILCAIHNPNNVYNIKNTLFMCYCQCKYKAEIMLNFNLEQINLDMLSYKLTTVELTDEIMFANLPQIRARTIIFRKSTPLPVSVLPCGSQTTTTYGRVIRTIIK